VSSRNLVVLGSASQVPTRYRNHNGYLLRWDREGILFDPGEGTQRQFTFAEVSPARINRICLTHLHGDHCLGLPGVLQRLALDQVDQEIPIHFPATGLPYVERLCDASIGRRHPVRLDPVPLTGGVVVDGPPLRITARPLDHAVDTLGWRVEEPAGRHFLTDRLEALGIEGTAVGDLRAHGSIDIGGRTVTVDEVSEHRPGQSVAFVMDTRACDAAIELARDADLFVCEATFLESEVDLAVDYGHLTARQAATIAREARARRLVLTHFSSRYTRTDAHVAEAAEVFPDVVAAEDLAVIPVPPAPHGRPPADAPAT
jgi:ribonuclease Z